MKARVIQFSASHRGDAEATDEVLVAACAGGEASALGDLFDRHVAVVSRFLGRMGCADQHDLEDLVQETFLQVFRSARRFRRGSSVRTWILGISLNVLRHHRRAEARRRALVERLPAPPHEHAPDVEQHTAQRELAGRLALAIPELPPDLRAAFVLCDMEGLTGAEAAKVLGVPEGTLWRRLHDARCKLRARLERWKP